MTNKKSLWFYLYRLMLQFMTKIRQIHKTLTLLIITSYRRWLSPAFLPRCRFYPCCSSYAKEALQVHGFFKGCLLTVKRLLSCHPFGPYGIDFVPKKHKRT